MEKNIQTFAELKEHQRLFGLNLHEFHELLKAMGCTFSKSTLYRWLSSSNLKKEISPQDILSINHAIQRAKEFQAQGYNLKDIINHNKTNSTNHLLNPFSIPANYETLETINSKSTQHKPLTSAEEKKSNEILISVAKSGMDEEAKSKATEDFQSYLLKFISRIPFAEDLVALWIFIQKVDLITAAPAIGALLYFISPIDLVPDYLPIAGFIDDAGVIAAVVAHLSTQLEPLRPEARKTIREWTQTK
ncbi:YkvA family protein [Bdellovibrio bacteriovorus]|uniref:YkvA family protein n=1 Tax=Bdellovibrio bacteriovorus TaxID=959 RepID=UPI0035A6D417